MASKPKQTEDNADQCILSAICLHTEGHNSCLIDAAPDLLEVCKQLVYKWDETKATGRGWVTSPFETLTRAAIAKAEDQQ